MGPETTCRPQGTVGTAETILAQPLHPRVRRIVEHWASMGPPGRLPGRPHLDPLHIPSLLSNMWLLDVEREPRLRLRYRLIRSEEHTSELQSLMRISYAVFCLKKKNKQRTHKHNTHI